MSLIYRNVEPFGPREVRNVLATAFAAMMWDYFKRANAYLLRLDPGQPALLLLLAKDNKGPSKLVKY